MIDLAALESFFKEPSNLKTLVYTIVLIASFLILKGFLLRRIEKKSELDIVDKKKLKSSFAFYFNLATVSFVFFLWFSQLQTIFISMLAVAAAIVLATKELIMNLTGGVLIKINKHFKLSDRIEVDGVRGFVIEKNLTTTKVLEIGPEKNSQQTTGDMIVIPNSVFLAKSVKNESFFKEFSIKSYSFFVPKNVELRDFELDLHAWAKEICQEYLEKASGIIEQFCHREGLTVPKVNPRTKIVQNDEGELLVLLKMPVKNYEIGDVEQTLLRQYVEKYSPHIKDN